MSNDLRLYTFVNFYLSAIQQGIQSAHVGTELSSKYRHARSKASRLLQQWEDDGKTMIVLNGGMAANVYTDYKVYHNAVMELPKQSVYPFAAFYEEPGAIHETKAAMTAWGIVLPPEVYNAKPVEVFPARVGFSTVPQNDIADDTSIWEPGSIEYVICTILQGKSLAR